MKRTRPTHPLRTMNKRYFLRFGSAAAAALFLFCSCGAKGGSESETTYADGVQYEYSDGGHSERVSARNVWKNGAVAERSIYDYWENGKLKAITNYSGDTETDSWHYSYTEAGTLSAMVRRRRGVPRHIYIQRRGQDRACIVHRGWDRGRRHTLHLQR